jgi:hypothetical protein
MVREPGSKTTGAARCARKSMPAELSVAYSGNEYGDLLMMETVMNLLINA